MTVRALATMAADRLTGAVIRPGELVTLPASEALALARLGLVEVLAGPVAGVVEHRDPVGRGR